MIDVCIDLVITFAVGLAFGLLFVYRRVNHLLGALASAFVGGLLGLVLLQSLPMDAQSIQYLLQLSGVSDQLNLAYSQGGLSGLVSIAPYVEYYVVAVGVVMALLGYSLVILASGSGKKRRHG